MTWNRRELLAGLGLGSASLLALPFGLTGCATPARQIRLAPQVRTEVRTWLRDAVARLAAVFPHVHALAVSRQRTTAAIDLLGTGVSRGRRDGVVFTLRDRDGVWREQVAADLTQAAITAAVRALVPSSTRPAKVTFPEPPPAPPPLSEISDASLRNRVGAIMRNDKSGSSRIVYAAAVIDLDDVTTWSIAPGHDREGVVRRVHKRAIRAAWNGTRPSVSEVERGWIGDVDDQQLTEDEVTSASRNATWLMTPGGFTDGDQLVVLEPGVAATIIDATVRGLLTTAAARRPEVGRRLALGANVAANTLTLVDDPTTPHAYGGFAFDDEGELAVPITLLDAGHVSGRLGERAGTSSGAPGATARGPGFGGRGRRPGHLGELGPAPSHLRLAPGTAHPDELLGEGWLLEGKGGAVFDPASDRIVVSVARAHELKAGSRTGRVYADVELAGDLASLLASVSGISADATTTSIRDEVDGEPVWRSITAPWLRTRGTVRARRRPA